MKTPFLPTVPLLLAGASAFLFSCVSSPQSRIEANPSVYEGLGKSDKGMVSQGRIKEGMSPEAVFIAWGKPDSVKTSSEGGRITETWLYRGAEPVFTHSAYVGHGYSRHYGHGYYYPGYCYAPTVHYRSYVSGKVTLRNRRVVQWETTGP